MSHALWCDTGHHAFSDKDPLRQHFSQTQNVRVHTGNSYGAPTYQSQERVTEELDICGPCYSKVNPFRPETDTPQLPGRYDAQKTRDLEEELGIAHQSLDDPATDHAKGRRQS